MNVISSTYSADAEVTGPRSALGVAQSGRVGDRLLSGLDRLIAGEHPVTLDDVGPVYAAGERATILLKGDHSPGTAPATLQSSLNALSLPAQTVNAYVAGIRTGRPLFWIRTDDRRSAEAALVLDSLNGRYVTGNLPATALR